MLFFLSSLDGYDRVLKRREGENSCLDPMSWSKRHKQVPPPSLLCSQKLLMNLNRLMLKPHEQKAVGLGDCQGEMGKITLTFLSLLKEEALFVEKKNGGNFTHKAPSTIT